MSKKRPEKKTEPPFSVAFFSADTDTQPFMLLPIKAKMPLGALAFGILRVGEKKAGRVEVSYEGKIVRTFYHVAVQGSQLKYDNAVIVEE